MQAIATSYPDLFVDVRGWGLINGMELNPDLELSSIDIIKAAMSEGLLIAPAGPKVLRFVPPLIVSEAEIDRGISMLEKAILTAR